MHPLPIADRRGARRLKPRSIRIAATVCCVIVMAAPGALAQTNLQLWGNVTLDWARSARLVYELDLEPKVLLAAPEGEPGWRNLDVTPNVEYSAKRWLDLVGEATVGYTHQTDNVNSMELSPRVGLRFHIFSRHVPTTGGVFGVRELPPARRIVVRDLVRFESRNIFYTDNSGEPNSFTSRFRNRLEFLVPLNKADLSNDGVRYFLADWEWFVPAGEPAERFANKQRIRTGIGFRRSFSWRLEILYMWTRSRDTVQEGFKTSDNSIDVRLKRVF